MWTGFGPWEGSLGYLKLCGFGPKGFPLRRRHLLNGNVKDGNDSAKNKTKLNITDVFKI